MAGGEGPGGSEVGVGPREPGRVEMGEPSGGGAPGLGQSVA